MKYTDLTNEHCIHCSTIEEAEECTKSLKLFLKRTATPNFVNNAFSRCGESLCIFVEVQSLNYDSVSYAKEINFIIVEFSDLEKEVIYEIY